MTENKRFEMIITSADGSFHYLDKNTDEKIISTLELENKLNALHEENTRLLKANMELTEENTNILSTIRQAYQTERTTLGRNVLKQLLDNLE